MGELALRGGKPVRDRPFAKWPVHDDRERSLLLEVLESGHWSYNGPKELAFEQSFARYYSAEHAICVSSGTAALELALRAMGIGPGDQVVVPALTWTAPAWAVIQAGGDVVFADVGPDWCLAPATFADAITDRTRAVVVVHTYCQVAEMDEILAIASRHRLAVLEDCAHAHGARWGSRSVGTMGDAGCFSFQLGKSLTAGEGGAVVTDDRRLADRLRGLKNCGRPNRAGVPHGFAGNQRITEFQAALLLAQLERLDEQNARRMANLAYFRAAMTRVHGLTPLPAKEQVTREGAFAIAMDYEPSLFGGLPSDLLITAMNAEGVPARRPHEVVYRSPLWQSGMTARFWHPGEHPGWRLGLHASCPVAERISDGAGIILPHQLFLGDRADVDDVVEAFGKVRAQAGDLLSHA